MKHPLTFIFLATLSMGLAVSCNTDKMEDIPDFANDKTQKKVNFDVLVTRDGKVVTKTGTGMMVTKGAGVTTGESAVTMDSSVPFGLVAYDPNTHEVVVDNKSVYQDGSGTYSTYFDQLFLGGRNAINFSAYYPRVANISYGGTSSQESYTIPYSLHETEAGPLVSKTVKQAVDQLSMIPLVFQHITNDIGFKVCDVTPMPELQGLIHLRKLTATNVAKAGTFVNDVEGNTGVWNRQGYYTNVVVFEGDALVGVGSENEKFVGFNTLEDKLMDSHRYYSIPDDILMGKQCVEVEFDVDGFDIEGYQYKPLKGQKFKYMLYGLLPDNIFVYGKQYTFHIGLDLSSIYHQITFAPAVSEWQTNIYENNDDF